MKKYVALADMFSDKYIGGAELTTDAILEDKDDEVIRIESNSLTESLIDKHKDKTWFIFNFSFVDDKLLVKIAKNINYSIVEYDYKFCKYRSLEKCFTIQGKECPCVNEGIAGKIKKIFYGYSKRIWFMSEMQRQIFLDNVVTIDQEKTKVLSSVFSDGDLRFIDSISNNEKGEKYLILNSNSWIKGTSECVKYAGNNNLQHEMVSGLEYQNLLIKMSTSKGLIFKPLGGDTCPRIVIEAKLLGCDLILNENVQHKDEEWFSTPESCFQYLKSRKDVFWSFYE